MNKIRVLLVEDDLIWQQGLSAFLNAEPDIEVAAVAGTKDEALERFRSAEPDVVLMDINLSDNRLDGLEAAKEILRVEGKVTSIIMVTSLEEKGLILQSFQSGAANFISKSSYKDIAQAIRDAHANRSGIHPDAASLIRKEIRLMALTPSERELYDLREQGLSKTQISGKLNKSLNTIKTQWKSIKQKLFDPN
ncbi:response regulator transcription factor [Paenibacillus methanolicus]|uniref:Two-component system, NarL family, response regulator LiaR n=1 Tax=Paenibacillus methanolicus TaxID=582686 RepID=A0A5S5CBH0_9BACL|nr:response regulator transcription factor [Paenibacillus methanolicus]TYP76509.1 two-component system, NarL family, response regulator LiaR [Paenibacillus methanolicus]